MHYVKILVFIGLWVNLVVWQMQYVNIFSFMGALSDFSFGENFLGV